MRPSPPNQPLRVLEAVNPPDGTTRYVDQVVSSRSESVTFSFLSVSKVVKLDYDVVHFHWPEMLVRHRRKTVEAIKCFVFLNWLKRLKRNRIGIVRTMHNVQPHESVAPIVLRAVAALEDATDLTVVINPATPVPRGGAYIPHAHYRSRFESHPKRRRREGRVLYAGLIRPYKGVEQLLRAFARLHDDAITLRIVGKPTAELGRFISQAVDADPGRLSCRLEFLPDEDFVAEVTEADLVCLPYRELHNSGMLLVALSLDRPVLVPDTPSTRALASEVGPGWVLTFDGELEAKDIEEALKSARTAVRSTRPVLAHRDWEEVGRLYSEVFAAARDRALSR